MITFKGFKNIRQHSFANAEIISHGTRCNRMADYHDGQIVYTGARFDRLQEMRKDVIKATYSHLIILLFIYFGCPRRCFHAGNAS